VALGFRPVFFGPLADLKVGTALIPLGRQISIQQGDRVNPVAFFLFDNGSNRGERR